MERSNSKEEINGEKIFEKEINALKHFYDELSRPKEHGWWYDEERDYLVFQIDKDNSYDIEFKRLYDPEELLNFVFHTFGKKFINKDDMYELLKILTVTIMPESPLYRMQWKKAK
jgi:hypothetical protein